MRTKLSLLVWCLTALGCAGQVAYGQYPGPMGRRRCPPLCRPKGSCIPRQCRVRMGWSRRRCLRDFMPLRGWARSRIRTIASRWSMAAKRRARTCGRPVRRLARRPQPARPHRVARRRDPVTATELCRHLWLRRLLVPDLRGLLVSAVPGCGGAYAVEANSNFPPGRAPAVPIQTSRIAILDPDYAQVIGRALGSAWMSAAKSPPP